jgi:hypothetical protein
LEVQKMKIEDLDTKSFIEEKISEIVGIVGDGSAINALSGSADSSAVTVLARSSGTHARASVAQLGSPEFLTPLSVRCAGHLTY